MAEKETWVCKIVELKKKKYTGYTSKILDEWTSTMPFQRRLEDVIDEVELIEEPKSPGIGWTSMRKKRVSIGRL
jgi:hypothetical protein